MATPTTPHADSSDNHDSVEPVEPDLDAPEEAEQPTAEGQAAAFDFMPES